MFFFWQQHRSSVPSPFRGSPFGSSFLLNGLLCILFGLAILSSPELLAYLVALFFIVIGASLLATWWRLRR
jgi:uncharacterized membrane protein HdeD (DUF308 family)